MKTEDIYSIYRCHGCGQEWEAGKSMQESARRHAMATGHHVSGITVNSVVYNEPPKEGENAE